MLSTIWAERLKYQKMKPLMWGICLKKNVMIESKINKNKIKEIKIKSEDKFNRLKVIIRGCSETNVWGTWLKLVSCFYVWDIV